MYITVRLLSGFSKPLLYACPPAWPHMQKGTVVHVPVKNSIQPGLVINTHQKLSVQPPFTIKEARSYDAFPCDAQYLSLCEKIARLYYIDIAVLYTRIKQFLTLDRNTDDDQPHATSDTPPPLYHLTKPQQRAVDYLAPLITAPQFAPTLLHGVTGSGKTEVYAHLISHALTVHKSVIFLSPEVSLSMQFAGIFQAKLPHVTIFDFHSATRMHHKRELWNHLLNNAPVLICGVHLPVLLPISNLGLIIVDEEHETNYREKRHPKLQSRDIALLRSAHYQIPILLGSATPSVQSVYQARQHNWKVFRLTKRFNGSFPTIRKVLLTSDHRRTHFWISNLLRQALRDCLNQGNQAIIYINRRGFSFFIQCSSCGFIAECPHCSVSLTLHKYTDGETLQCHYCGYTTTVPVACPSCAKKDDVFIKKGIGTQHIISILRELFPHARIKRADLDSTRKKREWQQTVLDFAAGKLDILVGTQTITKGYHFPHVTLVGIIWGDLNLHFPSYIASETTLQQLIQVAGRAGREHDDSMVIIQALQDHPIFDYVHEEHYDQFITHELETRTLLKFPPASRFITIELRHTNDMQLARDAQTLYQTLERHQKKPAVVTILGPIKPIIYKIKRTHMRHIYLRSNTYSTAFALIDASNIHALKSSVHIIP